MRGTSFFFISFFFTSPCKDRKRTNYTPLLLILTLLLIVMRLIFIFFLDDTMVEHECLHEEQIQKHSRKIAELDTAHDYKEKRIDELYVKIDKMEDKIDTLNDNVNQLILQSNKDDNQLDLRLKAVETELELQKNKSLENHNRLTNIVAVAGVGLTIITILINVYFKMI